MIFPTKYEHLAKNKFVLGASIIQLLREENNLEFEILCRKLDENTSIVKIADTLTLLYFLGAIKLNNNKIELVNDTKKIVHTAD